MCNRFGFVRIVGADYCHGSVIPVKGILVEVARATSSRAC